MFTGWDRPSHWLVLAVVVVVLFGYKKLPDAARSVGRSLRIFKTEMKGLTEDDAAREAAKASPTAPTAAPGASVTESTPANLVKPTPTGQPQPQPPISPAATADNSSASSSATTPTTPGTV
jgi:sec-independent protein translocase protein TatA